MYLYNVLYFENVAFWNTLIMSSFLINNLLTVDRNIARNVNGFRDKFESTRRTFISLTSRHHLESDWRNNRLIFQPERLNVPYSKGSHQTNYCPCDNECLYKVCLESFLSCKGPPKRSSYNFTSCLETSCFETSCLETSFLETESRTHRRVVHPRRRRHRTMFSDDQLQLLESIFRQTKYPGALHRNTIARMIRLTEENVEVWFKNRRARWRKQKK